jgi:hypothetical protein
MNDLRSWARKTDGIVFDAMGLEVKYEEHGLEVHPEVNSGL